MWDTWEPCTTIGNEKTALNLTCGKKTDLKNSHYYCVLSNVKAFVAAPCNSKKLEYLACSYICGVPQFICKTMHLPF